MLKHLYRNWYIQEDLCYENVVYNNQQCGSIYTNYNGTVFPNYLYTTFVYPNDVGNSVEVRTAIIDSSTAELCISDGAYKISAYISSDLISIGTDAIYIDATQFNVYKLSLINGHYKLYINQALVAQGTADSSLDNPLIFYGFYTSPSISDRTYVSYIKNGEYTEQTFIVGDWKLNDKDGYNKTVYNDVSCGKLFIPLSDAVSHNFFYKDKVFDSTIGNTLSAKVALGFEDALPMLASEDDYLLEEDDIVFLSSSISTSGPLQLCISDGTYMVIADIKDGEVSIDDSSFSLDTFVFHEYWLTLKNGKYQLFVDKDLVLEGDAISSTSRRISVGFTRIPNDYDSAYIKYLKTAEGEKRPIDLSKVVCELQVDTSDTFNSANLKTYYSVDDLVFAKQDGANKVFINVNEDNTSEARTITITLDGVSGNDVSIGANDSAILIANAIVTQGIPAGWTATLSGTKITITKNTVTPIEHATKEYNYLTITGENPIDITFDILHRGTALGTGIVRSFTIPLLPRQEDEAVCYFFRVRVNNDFYTSDWAYYFYDEPVVDIIFSTKEQLSNTKYIVNRVVAFCYENRQSYMLKTNPTPEDLSRNCISISNNNAVWVPINNSFFMLDADNSNYYFNQVYNYRLPDEEVYTKYNYSGNIANAISSEATVIDIADFELKNVSRDLDIHLCRDSYLYNNFGSLYNLAQEYFNTVNEYRDTLLSIIKGFCTPGNTKVLKDILGGIMGVEPYIEEFKNTKKWILWDRASLLTKADNEKYILFNPEHLYTTKNKAVLYSNKGKAFTFNIHLYNPLGLVINPTMVRIIVDLFKPTFSQANIIFYDEEGLPIVYPAEYYFSDYGQGLFYAEDTLTEDN